MDLGDGGEVTREEEADEGEEMEDCEDLGRPLVIARQPPELGEPGEGTLHHPRLGSSTKPRFVCGSVTTTSSTPRRAASAAGADPV